MFLLKGTFRQDKGLFIHIQRPVQPCRDFHVTHEKHVSKDACFYSGIGISISLF